MSPGEYEQLVQFVGTRFDAIDRRLEQLGDEYHAVTEALRRIEGTSRN